jgi:hypothetical protein
MPQTASAVLKQACLRYASVNDMYDCVQHPHHPDQFAQQMQQQHGGASSVSSMPHCASAALQKHASASVPHQACLKKHASTSMPQHALIKHMHMHAYPALSKSSPTINQLHTMLQTISLRSASHAGPSVMSCTNGSACRYIGQYRKTRCIQTCIAAKHACL